MVKKYLLLILTLVLIGTLLIGCTNQQEDINEKKADENYVPVEVENASIRTLKDEVIFSGKIFPDKDIMVFPKVIGKVTDVRVSVGDKVTKGSILFTLDKEDIQKQVDQAKVALDGAKTSYELTKEKMENAKANLERTEKLYNEGAISKAQYEQAQLAASDKALEGAQIQLNQAELAYNQAKEALDNTIVTSPCDGIISSVNVEAGEMASNTQPAITIVDLDRVYVELNVAENMVNKILPNQEVEVIIPSVSDEKYIGKVDSISPSADARTQLYPVRIYIPNENHLIKSGMFAQVKTSIDTREDVIAVRSEAIVQKGEETVVYVVEDNKAVERNVIVGLDTGTYAEIVEGIKDGEKIIIKGQNYVENGAKVKVVRGGN